MPVNFPSKITPKLVDGTPAFTGIADAKEIIGDSSTNTFLDACLTATNVTQFAGNLFSTGMLDADSFNIGTNDDFVLTYNGDGDINDYVSLTHGSNVFKFYADGSMELPTLSSLPSTVRAGGLCYVVSGGNGSLYAGIDTA